MQLGAFSISLAVKDLQTSKYFYEKLGFTEFSGKLEHKYLIMKSGKTLIGLFEGMFEGNILTFNPGWNQSANTLKNYTDVRDIQEVLKAKGVELTAEADKSTKGAAHITLIDPDGNAILIDQHI